MKRNHGPGAEANYDVGYGKPPQRTRFRPGRSGNPRGRPKGAQNLKTDVRETLKTPVQLTSGGKPVKISTQKAMLLRLREMALGGDARALDQLISLAKLFNTEEEQLEAPISADDALLLELYKGRLLRGAIEGRLDAAEQSTSQTSSSEPTPRGSQNEHEGGEA